jgi:hypothetical protein
VLAPKAAARPDGARVRMGDRPGKGASYYYTDPNDPTGVAFGVPVPEGKSNRVALLPPGKATGKAKIGCSLPKDLGYGYASFRVVAGDSGHKSLDLECKPGAEPPDAANRQKAHSPKNPITGPNRDFANGTGFRDAPADFRYTLSG